MNGGRILHVSCEGHSERYTWNDVVLSNVSQSQLELTAIWSSFHSPLFCSKVNTLNSFPMGKLSLVANSKPGSNHSNYKLVQIKLLCRCLTKQ